MTDLRRLAELREISAEPLSWRAAALLVIAVLDGDIDAELVHADAELTKDELRAQVLTHARLAANLAVLASQGDRVEARDFLGKLIVAASQAAAGNRHELHVAYLTDDPGEGVEGEVDEDDPWTAAHRRRGPESP